MPRGIPGSGPFSGRGKKSNGSKARGRGRRTTTLAEVAARSSGAAQTASDGAKSGTARTATGRGRRSAGKTPGRGGAKANSGQQRAETESKTGNTGQTNGATEIGGVKIETLPVPGRGGRPQQAEKFPFASLDVAEKQGDGSIVGPSFLIPEADQPDNILAAARKRHRGMTFMSRKMEGGVRIWRAK